MGHDLAEDVRGERRRGNEAERWRGSGGGDQGGREGEWRGFLETRAPHTDSDEERKLKFPFT